MNVIKAELPGVLILEPRVFEDERGFFYESYNHRVFEESVGHEVAFVQDNHSKSLKGVLRGLHFQLPPHAQGKLVRVVQGEVYDVAVDLRNGSASYGQWVGLYLSSENRKQIWIPEGFAHGFLTLSETSEFLYKTTDYYYPEYERCIRWDDSDISVKWPETESLKLSDKDINGELFKDLYLQT